MKFYYNNLSRSTNILSIGLSIKALVLLGLSAEYEKG